MFNGFVIDIFGMVEQVRENLDRQVQWFFLLYLNKVLVVFFDVIVFLFVGGFQSSIVNCVFGYVDQDCERF